MDISCAIIIDRKAFVKTVILQFCIKVTLCSYFMNFLFFKTAVKHSIFKFFLSVTAIQGFSPNFASNIKRIDELLKFISLVN